VTAEFLDRPGGRVAFEVGGDGPLVVCVPGMGDLRSVYRFLAPELVGAGYRVACMDLRGHGDSDTTFDAYDDVATAGDMVALVEHLGGRAVLVGNSMAAGAAVLAAAQAPAVVAGLVLLGPAVRDRPMGAGAQLAFRLALMRPWGLGAWVSYYRRLYPGRPPADLAEHQGRIRASLRDPAHWRSFVATTHTSHAPAESRLAEVQAPTLVVMGDHDPDFPDPAAEAAWVARQLKGIVVLVSGAGHYPQAQCPEVVGPAVRRFLSQVGHGAAG
jgi:pimeloyl-ACP methyl ester carboxylesterase